MISASAPSRIPRTLRRPLPTRLRLTFMLLLMLEELDLVTSLTGHPGVIEGNVLVAGVLTVGGGFAFLLMKSVGSLIVYGSVVQLSRLSHRVAEFVLAVASLLMVAVVVSNLRLVLG
jgi:hypothetical protein